MFYIFFSYIKKINLPKCLMPMLVNMLMVLTSICFIETCNKSVNYIFKNQMR